MMENRRDLYRDKKNNSAVRSRTNTKEKSSIKADTGKVLKNKTVSQKKVHSTSANHSGTGKKKPGSPVKSNKRRRSRKRSGFLSHLSFILGGVLIILLVILGIGYYQYQKALHSTEKLPLSDAVLAYQDTVDKYAAEYDLQDYTDYIMAIIQVESGGNGSDVMQSSESAGLEVNTYSPEESIEQGCAYFRELLNALNYFDGDLDTLLQAYNYGNNFIVYVSENGGKYTFDLSTEYAKEKSGGEKVSYWNIVALRRNMNWRYAYGNMFYVDLIHQYL